MNKCIGVQPGLFVASEVNPAVEEMCGRLNVNAQRLTLKWQAKEWLGLDLEQKSFAARLNELVANCSRRGLRLLIRDWSYINFERHPLIDLDPPGRLLALENIISEDFEVKAFAFVRDAIDVWISRRMPRARMFFGNYRRYVEALLSSKIPIYRYEDFCEDPHALLYEIFRHVDIPYAREHLRRYQLYDHVMGDDLVPGGSRGKNQGDIRPLPRLRIAPWRVNELSSCPDLEFVQRALGYSSAYEDRTLEARWRSVERLFRRGARVISRRT